MINIYLYWQKYPFTVTVFISSVIYLKQRRLLTLPGLDGDCIWVGLSTTQRRTGWSGHPVSGVDFFRKDKWIHREVSLSINNKMVCIFIVNHWLKFLLKSDLNIIFFADFYRYLLWIFNGHEMCTLFLIMLKLTSWGPSCLRQKSCQNGSTQ